MNGEQYRAAIARLNMNISEAARFLGVTVNTSGRYANDRLKVPPVVQRFLAYAIEKEGRAADAASTEIASAE